jgi:hypothetical protein
MHIPCFMLSRIVVPSWWILSNHLDFSNHNFVTKLPNPGSLKLPTINCFLRRELRLGKLFHWQFVFTKIWYNQKQPCTARPKILSCCDEIMLRDEITGFDGNVTTAGLGFLEVDKGCLAKIPPLGSESVLALSSTVCMINCFRYASYHAADTGPLMWGVQVRAYCGEKV